MHKKKNTLALYTATLTALALMFTRESRTDDAVLVHSAITPTIAGTKAPRFVDLTADFARIADATDGMEEAARIARVRTQMDALLPGFYAPRDSITPARFDARVAKALRDFDSLRPRYEQVRREFPAAFDAGIEHFRKVFPDSVPNLPVYLVHSLGEMDGGLRNLGGQTYLIFGADVIARLHDRGTITPLLNHELFHVENGKYFADCGEVWCALWVEGLATYAAKVMNPGADDRQLLLTTPRPIRSAVDASWPAAACFTRERLSSSAEEELQVMFAGGPAVGEFPRRFGYYVGLRAIEESAGAHELPDLAKMGPEQAKSVLTAGLDGLIQNAGGCPEVTSRRVARVPTGRSRHSTTR